MTEGHRRVAVPLVFFWFAALPPAFAEIHEHEIRRLLYLHSSCGVESLVRIAGDPHERRFRAECRNSSAFPEGVLVVCTDIDDDRSCRIDTRSNEFNSLDLLRRTPELNPGCR